MLFFLALALAADPPPPTRAELDAEYVRLSAELQRAAEKNNWLAVDRHYRAALKTGAQISIRDHRTAAAAARAQGDTGALRQRLLAALAIDMLDTSARADLELLHSQNGWATLSSDPGSILEDYERPFDPMKLRAVDFAIAQVKETGHYQGFLPPGPYALNGDPFELAAGGVFELDVSSPPLPPAPEKKGLKGLFKKKAKQQTLLDRARSTHDRELPESP